MTRSVHSRSRVVRVAVVNEELRALGDAADALRAQRQLLPRVVTADAAHRNHAFTECELGVLDDPIVTLDLEAKLEAEGLDEPVDGGVRIFVEDRDGHARPALGWWFHKCPFMSDVVKH